MKLSSKRTMFQFFTVIPITLVLSYYEIKPFSISSEKFDFMQILAIGVLFYMARLLFDALERRKANRNQDF